MEVKDIIKNKRVELGLSQLDVAKYVGVSEATVSRWESGDIANMGAGRIKLLSQVLRVSPLEILGDEPPQAEKACADDEEFEEVREYYRTRPELKILFSATKNAKAENLRRAAAIVEALEKEESGEK